MYALLTSSQEKWAKENAEELLRLREYKSMSESE